MTPDPTTAQCWCETCRPNTLTDSRMIVCPQCGNKRCPRATHHDNPCTGSNAPGQRGSSWESYPVTPDPTKEPPVSDPVDVDELERLAKAAYAEYWGLSEPDTTREWASLPNDERVRFRDMASVIVRDYEPGGHHYQLVVAERDALRKEADALREIVGDLPKTADGKPVVPDEVVFHDKMRDKDGKPIRLRVEGWEAHWHHGHRFPVRECYSAIEALATPGAGTGDGGGAGTEGTR